MYRHISRWRKLDILKKYFASQQRCIQTCSSLTSKVTVTDHQTDDENIERVSKIQTIKGFDILRNPKLNKSTTFTMVERQILGIHGLLPPAVNSQQVQMERVMSQLRSLPTDLQRYISINQILSSNERLYFQLLREHTEELLGIVYTPTVGYAIEEFGLLFRDPRGLFITIYDLGHVYDIVTNWPERRVQAVVMTDGERTLGLGDYGSNAMGIPIGKLALYTACGGIHPSACLPIVIDVGTNNETLLNDPMYIGLRQRRDTTDKYFQLIDETIAALQKRYGKNVLIQYEDFAGHNASLLLDKTFHKDCVFNDDIQGTGAAVLAGVLSSLRVSGMKLADHTFMFFGAGATGCGSARMIYKMLRKQGVPKQEAAKKIWMYDADGLITRYRPLAKITTGQTTFAHDAKPIDNFEEAVDYIKPTTLIGISGIGGAFTEEVCRKMATHCPRPNIFAMSNPASNSECTPEQAYTWTEGKCLFVSGTPFDPVTLQDGSHFVPAQGNNIYIFPGLVLGVIATASQRIPENMFLCAAETVANEVSEAELKSGRLYPALSKIKEISFEVATSVGECAYKEQVANVMTSSENVRDLVRASLYNPDYISFVPKTFSYPSGHAELDFEGLSFDGFD